MPIRHLVWACITCGREGALEPRKEAEVCARCGTHYERARGARIFVRQQGSEGRTYWPLELTKLLSPAGMGGTAQCEIREWLGDTALHAFGRYLGRYERLGEPRTGTLTLGDNRLRFAAHEGPSFDVPVIDITAIQPSSQTLQIKAKGRPLFSIRFPFSSPKLWEERLQAALNAAYQAAGRGLIAEFQPRVCVAPVPRGRIGESRVRRRLKSAHSMRPGRPWQYRLASWIARNAWKHLGGGLTVEGLQHIPESGPFLVIANHESYLETMLVPAVIPRPAHAMAKSTQFGLPVYGWLMPRLFAFPVRRFEIDPQAVRFLTRRLAEGYGVVIFPEGERTWDGALQPARLGVVRLAVEAGVPVIPCIVSGAYEAWPRWSSRPQRHRIRLTFAAPLEFAAAPTTTDREAGLAAAVRLVQDALGRSPTT